MAAAILISFLSSGAAGAGAASSTPSSNAAGTALRVSAPEKCKHARKAVVFYRGQYHSHRARLGAGRPATTLGRSTAPCSQVRFLAFMWRSRAYVARVSADATLYFRKVRERQRLSNPTVAICSVFGPYCAQALRVASCESGRGINAQNGQYLGMFQMGSYARSRYGHGYTALVQAKAAYRYFVDSGRDWSPWSCKP